ncbi:MAG: hypothetical protein J7L82_07325, partial [Staphylothermus sp.]|nr:hypothetical protein [Staphylothermus sp.]
IYGKPVNVYGGNIAIGTLIPAILESRLYENIKIIKKKFLKVIDKVKPVPELTRKYRDLAEKYFDHWKILNELYKTL